MGVADQPVSQTNVCDMEVRRVFRFPASITTPQQDVSSQRLAILEYARTHDIRIDDFTEATTSGQASEKPADRRADEGPAARRPPGRQRALAARPAAGSDRDDPRRPRQGRGRLGGAEGEHPGRGQARYPDEGHDHLFALFAEVERDLISERTREGLARARPSRRKLGRPKGSLCVSRLDGKEDEIRALSSNWRLEDRHRQAHGVSGAALYGS